MRNVWSVPGPSVEPVIALVRWRVMEERGARRLSGYSVTTREGRLSAQIVAFELVDVQRIDAVQQPFGRVRTASGRAHHLFGPPGYDDHAQYVLEQFGLAEGRFKDVTIETMRDWGVTP